MLNIQIVSILIFIPVTIVILICAKTIRRADYELQYVAIVHRHGDRYPVTTYLNDPYKDYPWPGGLGALSRKGILQMFSMGTRLRSRYKSLLPSDGFYTKKDIHVVSSNLERCLMSVESLLAGMMPPPDDENPLPLTWQPIPVSIIPADRDYILYQDEAPCPKYDQIYQKFLNDPDPQTNFYAFNEGLSELYGYMSQSTGESVTNVQQVGDLENVLSIQQNYGLELPKWSDAVFPDDLLPVRIRSFQLYTETAYMKRIKAHDKTLANVMSALDVSDQTEPLPDFGATLVFELYCGDNEECTVNTTFILFKSDLGAKQMFYYFNTDDETPKQLFMPNCPDPCTLSQYEVAINHIRIRNFTKDCEMNDNWNGMGMFCIFF